MRKKQGRRPEDYIYDRLKPEDLANLRAYMVVASDGEGPSEANCDLGNAGLCVPCKPPYTERDLRLMLVVLAAARVSSQTTADDWKGILKSAFGSRAESIRLVYEKATGVTDLFVFAPIHFRRH